MELGSLSNLVKLVLWGNELTGEIPVELGTLANLTSLSVSQNQLRESDTDRTGQPSTNLEELHLWGNELTGEIPVEPGQSHANLEVLSLSDNQLSGVVPQTLAGLTMLEILQFLQQPGSLCAGR